VEEVLWRGGLLGSLVPRLGPAAALGLATAAFALAHIAGRGLRGVPLHLLTGAVFGLAYLASDLIWAPVFAHVLYNALVASVAVGEGGGRIGHLASAAVLWRTPAATMDVDEVELAPAATLEGVTKHFGATLALDDVTLDLPPGEVTALLGPNGAGKTTALSLLLGLRRPDAGRVRLFGSDPRRPAARSAIGVAQQETRFPETLRVREVAALVCAHYPAPFEVGELLERFGLSSLARRQTGGLSGGERRRLAVALAFAGRPAAVFLDEPTAGLDVEGRRQVWATVREYVGRGGTVLLTTHYLEEAEALATRVAVLHRGRLVLAGHVREVAERVGLSRVQLRNSPLPRLEGVARRSRENGAWSLYTRDAGRLVEALVRHGVPLDGLLVQAATLEQVILSLEGCR
jgi:ABC-2 type transport system ATP-binding protein